MGLPSRQWWGAIHLSVFSIAGAPYPLVKLPEKGCVSLVLCLQTNKFLKGKLHWVFTGHELTHILNVSLMPLEVSRFSFYLVTLNCWRSSDSISMHEVTPLTLASRAPGHGSSPLPPVPGHRGGQKRLQHLPAPLRGDGAHRHRLGGGWAALSPRPARPASPSCLADPHWGQPGLSGIQLHPVGERL